MKSPVESPVLRRIRPGDRTAVRRFWSRRQATGTPLTEAIRGDPEHCRVTFLWRSARACDVSVLSSLDSYSRDGGRLTRLSGTDIWYKSYHVRSDVRTVYYITDALPPGGRPSIAQWVQYYRRWQKDPLNPQEFLFPADPEDPEDRDQVGSVLTLPSARPHPRLAGAPPTGVGRIELQRFRSRTLGNVRRIWIYRPPPLSGSKSVATNLLVVFDGQAYLTLVPTPTVLDRLQARGQIDPTYAVLIDSLSNEVRSRELRCNRTFAASLVREILPWAERKLRQSFTPERRVLVGSSLGGLAAAYVALRYPGKFGNVLSQSAPFAWAPEDEEPSLLPREYAAARRTAARFCLEAGILETDTRGLTGSIPSILDSNRHMRDVLRAKGYHVVYREFAGGHDYLWWRDTLGPALRTLLRRSRSGFVTTEGRRRVAARN